MLGYRMPTRVHIAPGARQELRSVLSILQAKRALLVIDPGLAQTAWPEEIQQQLSDLQIELFDRVEPNPRTRTAELAAEQIRDKDLDAVVALGGGSVLDAAKAAAMLATNPGKAADYVGKNRYSHRPKPFIALPTTCGTGSEVTWVSVLSDEATQTKISLKGETMFPVQALVDADLIRTLPNRLVAWTGLDALTHALEATTGKANNPVSDALAGSAIALLFRFLPRAVADVEHDAQARQEVMRASTLAGLSFSNADVAAVHCLSETLGGLYDVPHGLANAVLLAPILAYHRPCIETRLAELARLLDSNAPERDDEAAEFFLERLVSLCRELDVPAFSTFEVPRDAWPEIARRAVQNGSNESNPQPMQAKNYLEILQRLDG